MRTTITTGISALFLLAGCSSVKPISSMDPGVYTAQLAGKDVDIQRLKESEEFEEAMVEDVSRELVLLREKVRKFVAYPHTCKHLGMLK